MGLRLRHVLFFLINLHVLQFVSANRNFQNNVHAFKDDEIRRLGTVADDFSSPLPISYVNVKDMPPSFDWGNVGGRSFLTHSLNQHLPHYCGSCFAHGSLSALADRIKIARGALSPDINLSIQFVLNCGSDVAGSCHGGSGSGVYEFVKKNGFVPFDTCMPYVACSADLENGICEHMDFSCSSINTCRTCTHLGCGEVDIFPNATVAEYGTIIKFNIDAIKAEIFVRGPVAASINGKELHTYTGGIFNNTNASNRTTHIVSIVGWGVDKESGMEYWRCRNSWGEFYGEMGFFRIGPIGRNVLGVESEVVWATPGQWTEHNVPCWEDGSNCQKNNSQPNTGYYTDPSKDFLAALSQRRQLSSGRIYWK